MNKRLIKRAITAAYYYLYRKYQKRTGNRILLYHSVGTKLPFDTIGISISPFMFEEHISLLKNIYSFVPLNAESYTDNLSTDTISVCFDDGFKDNLHTAAPILLKNNIPFSVFVTTSFLNNGSGMYLTEYELKELASFDNVIIGSHGATHKQLAQCDTTTLWEELYSSKCYLEDLLGKPIKTLSYPHGSVNRRVREAAERAGYELGGCSVFGLNNTESDVLLLRRTEVLASDTKRTLCQKLLGAWDWYEWRQMDPAAE